MTPRCICCPRREQLTTRTWRALERRARDGATVYLSYCSGRHPATSAAPGSPVWTALFGVSYQLATGWRPIEDDILVMTFTEDFGRLTAGETLRFPVGGNEDSRAYLPVVPRGARVVATDAHGRPALLVHETGRGRTVLATYPLEHMAARTARVNPEQTHRLYAALAELAGVGPRGDGRHPVRGADVLVHEDGRRFVWLVSQSAEALTVRPRADGELRDLATGETVTDIGLDAYGVRVLELI